MNVKQRIRSRAHRVLENLSNYRDISDSSEPHLLSQASFSAKEDILGVYENIPGAWQEAIIISDAGLRIFLNAGWLFIPYADMCAVDVPGAKDKQTVDLLLIRLVSGITIELPVRGGRGKLRDVWEFLRYLQRVHAIAQDLNDTAYGCLLCTGPVRGAQTL